MEWPRLTQGPPRECPGSVASARIQENFQHRGGRKSSNTAEPAVTGRRPGVMEPVVRETDGSILR